MVLTNVGHKHFGKLNNEEIISRISNLLGQCEKGIGLTMMLDFITVLGACYLGDWHVHVAQRNAERQPLSIRMKRSDSEWTTANALHSLDPYEPPAIDAAFLVPSAKPLCARVALTQAGLTEIDTGHFGQVYVYLSINTWVSLQLTLSRLNERPFFVGSVFHLRTAHGDGEPPSDMYETERSHAHVSHTQSPRA